MRPSRHGVILHPAGQLDGGPIERQVTMPTIAALLYLRSVQCWQISMHAHLKQEAYGPVRR